MRERFVLVVFVAVGALHLIPVTGVLSAARLESLYGVGVDDPNLLVLLRHRAVLFGIVGLILVAAAFLPGIRSWGAAAGLLSMLSFIVLALATEGLSAPLRRVLYADIIGSVWMGVALGLDRWSTGVVSLPVPR